MKSRQILLAIIILGTLWQTAVAQPKKKIIQVDSPPLGSIVAGASKQSNPVLTGLMDLKPQVPLGPQDVLKSYEIAMSTVADSTSSDFAVIVRAQQSNQITREQAEYLLQQRYELAMMQYQVLGALHDVLKHDIEEAAQQSRQQSLKSAESDTVLVVPFPGSSSGSQ